MILLHYWQLQTRGRQGKADDECWAYGSDLLVVGIVRYCLQRSYTTSKRRLTGVDSNYAAVAADTFSC